MIKLLVKQKITFLIQGGIMLRMIVYLDLSRYRKIVHFGPFTEEEAERIVTKWGTMGKKNRVYVSLYKVV